MKFRKRKEVQKRPDWDNSLESSNLKVSDEEKDFGVLIESKLSSEDCISEKVRNVFSLLANMRVASAFIDEEMMK